ncbi:hypothetical protein F383_27162 [Gossypium arboreum]|uniref:Uncharacterized protein n=1 Tax=Gossypium arboreum TaxID=29729 RepID=A0A0B0MM65_GOSAR|nr:hypothetical protein F383_27162 [Gossypium arboreum]
MYKLRFICLVNSHENNRHHKHIVTYTINMR